MPWSFSFSYPLAELVHVNTAMWTSLGIRLITLVSKALRSLHENYTQTRIYTNIHTRAHMDLVYIIVNEFSISEQL